MEAGKCEIGSGFWSNVISGLCVCVHGNNLRIADNRSNYIIVSLVIHRYMDGDVDANTRSGHRCKIVVGDRGGHGNGNNVCFFAGKLNGFNSIDTTGSNFDASCFSGSVKRSVIFRPLFYLFFSSFKLKLLNSFFNSFAFSISFFSLYGSSEITFLSFTESTEITSLHFPSGSKTLLTLSKS